VAVECLVSRDVIWQPGHVAEESITATADGLGDGRETSVQRVPRLNAVR